MVLTTLSNNYYDHNVDISKNSIIQQNRSIGKDTSMADDNENDADNDADHDVNDNTSNVRFFLGGIVEDQPITVGDYEYYPKDKLGEGAFGTVYRGRQLSSGAFVALKSIATDRLKEGEVDAIVRAQSECVVRFLDVVKSERTTYIVMELCDTDLARFLSAYGGKLTEENLLTVGRCLAEGYSVLHRHGIVHRDIKPQNILIKLTDEMSKEKITTVDENDPNGGMITVEQPKILSGKFTDFGCSRRCTDAEGMPCNLAGTFFYMAPEVGANVVDCHGYDEEVDMWSMGIVLYQCMAGHVPFDERQLCRLFLHAIDGNDAGYEPPIPEHGPEHYRNTVRKLLQLDPQARLKPIQFHTFLAHDQPESFLQCLRQGSCSEDNYHLNGGAATAAKTADRKQTRTLRKSAAESVPAFRRTASAFFGRLVAMCGQQHHIGHQNL